MRIGSQLTLPGKKKYIFIIIFLTIYTNIWKNLWCFLTKFTVKKVFSYRAKEVEQQKQEDINLCYIDQQVEGKRGWLLTSVHSIQYIVKYETTVAEVEFVGNKTVVCPRLHEIGLTVLEEVMF